MQHLLFMASVQQSQSIIVPGLQRTHYVTIYLYEAGSAPRRTKPRQSRWWSEMLITQSVEMHGFIVAHKPYSLLTGLNLNPPTQRRDCVCKIIWRDMYHFSRRRWTTWLALSVSCSVREEIRLLLQLLCASVPNLIFHVAYCSSPSSKVLHGRDQQNQTRGAFP